MKLVFRCFSFEFEVQIPPKSGNTNPTLLFFGILIPSVDTVFEVLKIRSYSLIIQSYSFGAVFLIIYFLSYKIKKIENNLSKLFTISFLIFSIIVLTNLVTRPFELVTFSGMLIIVLFSFKGSIGLGEKAKE